MDIDLNTLNAWIQSHFQELTGNPEIKKIDGGQSNPTYQITYPHRQFVLRRRPDGNLLPSAHAVGREFKVLKALANSDVKVPEVYIHCLDPEVAKTEFYLMEYVPGRVFHDNSLAQVLPRHRKLLYFEMARTLNTIHSVDLDDLGLTNFGSHKNYFARQTQRWTKQWELSKLQDSSTIEFLIKWLPQNIPPSNTTTLVHGDYRIGNLMFHSHDPTVVAVLDWELSTLGHPLADLANCCCYAWYLNSDEYGNGIRDLPLRERGLPTMEEFVEAYYSGASHQEEFTRFHLIFALFRMTVIFEGVAARGQAGNAASQEASQLGAIGPLLAERAAELTTLTHF